MNRELLILRHGKADKSVESDDFHRPLKDSGKRSIQRIGVWLQANGAVPDAIIASPALRAMESARKVCKVMGIPEAAIQQDKQLYLASSSQLMDLLMSIPSSAQRLLLVGHNPGLERMLGQIVDRGEDLPGKIRSFPTATVARVAMPDRWERLERGCGSLIDLQQSDALPKHFPYPGPGGSEYRYRPAYYYTQSSVIPFRENSGRVEILLVSSSQNKHWVVPKGIHDPGLSAQESALKEAREEAGIEGDILDLELDSYVYKKWGAACTVKVYPMRVDRMIPEEQWEERHRGRKWFTPEAAMKKVKQGALKPIIQRLSELLGEQ